MNVTEEAQENLYDTCGSPLFPQRQKKELNVLQRWKQPTMLVHMKYIFLFKKKHNDSEWY